MEEILFLLLLLDVRAQAPADLNPQPKPDKCNRPAEFMYRQCCIFPPFFTREVARVCGAIFKIADIDDIHNVTIFQRSALTACEHWRCMLKKYGMLNPDDTLDEDKYFAHIDRWVDLNPSFANVITNGKAYCKNVYRIHFPLGACDFFDLNSCLRNYVNTDCPVLIPSNKCKEVKEFYDECRDFYI